MHSLKQHLFLYLLISSALCFFLASCNLFEDNAPKVIAGQEDVYAGIYTQGIENSDFNPCIAQDEVWRISEIQDTASFFSRIREAEGNPVYMELKGAPSEIGEYRGFLMIYDREIKVEKAVSVKNLQDKDCATALLLD